MAVWEHLEVSKAHVAYACVGVFSSVFSLVSLFAKEKLYIGESTVAVIFGLIVGPHCLDWFNPLKWGNSDSITLEITRIVLCLQIFAVAVELPKKYMLKHWLSVAMLLLPVMTAGWLIIALFVWILIPGLNFPESLLVSSCITATDPILAQSVVSGKFAQRVPGHLRNLLSAESGCNDGMAFPFIYLSLNLIFHPGNGREIVKDWICVTILYECVFGCILGVFIGYSGRRAIRFAEEHKLIDRESFLAFYVVLAFTCAGFGSILGVDDLLVSFSAGAAFAWDGWFARSTEESNVSTVIDLLLNLAYFVFFGAIIPWQQFNDSEIGTNVWRLIILSIVVITLRRIPAVLVFKSFIPDIKTWREALFVGHFGPIGVGAVFAAILARSELEANATGEETPLKELPGKGSKHWQLIACVWPMTCFFIVTSIIVHGSSVAVITLGRHLNTITLTKSFTTHTTNGKGSSWMQRLPSLEKSGRSFSLQRIDTKAPTDVLSKSDTVETSGIPAKPAGGMKRRKNKKRRGRDLFRPRPASDNEDSIDLDLQNERVQREKEAQAAAFALSSQLRPNGDDDTYDDGHLDDKYDDDDDDQVEKTVNIMNSSQASKAIDNLDQMASNVPSLENEPIEEDRRGHITRPNTFVEDQIPFPGGGTTSSSNDYYDEEKSDKDGSSKGSVKGYSRKFEEIKRKMQAKAEQEEGAVAYAEGNRIIVENKQGEIIDQAELNRGPKDEEESIGSNISRQVSQKSAHSVNPLKKILTPPARLRRQTLIDEQGDKKYFAYKIDNQLIIENEDGEVLRRYRINTHGDGQKDLNQRPKSPSVVARALSAVGLTKSATSPPLPTPKNASKDPSEKIKARNLTPAPTAGPIGNETSEDESSDQTYSGDDSVEHSYSDEGNDWHQLDSDDSYGDDADEDDGEPNEDADEDEDEDGNEPETAIERTRRLTALGRVAAPRHADDEEVVPEVSFSTPPKIESHTGGVKAALERTFHKKT